MTLGISFTQGHCLLVLLALLAAGGPILVAYLSPVKREWQSDIASCYQSPSVKNIQS